MASSHVAFRERWTRGSGIDYFWWTAKKQLWFAQFFLINNYVIYLITTLGSTRLSTFWFKRKLNCLKNKTGLDLLTMLWTTGVLINKIINEKQPKGVYFADWRWGTTPQNQFRLALQYVSCLAKFWPTYVIFTILFRAWSKILSPIWNQVLHSTLKAWWEKLPKKMLSGCVLLKVFFLGGIS